MQIFDFSERKVSNRAAVLVDAADLGGAAHKQVLVTRVGDALQEYAVRHLALVRANTTCVVHVTMPTANAAIMAT